ncbi:MAG TPA: DegT/DnrJ/EryC1/StrS family aminotransferase [Baekduia sp.]|uniref:DegT/DnrJ/EryC1/StrS family aminotransferase n=1 Tax=Baekduia sp. TaxID=2600305 RepID=UPI002D795B57|nr:DegT/DnrJ/EryC1/StrS family aminotransferase [Baekduia sp.]HET6507085.1 DegT/DnrJ/EryC1/StrS family aminotransferase [Baekduia sp.]
MSRISNVKAALSLPQLLTPTQSWPEHGEREAELVTRSLGNQLGLGSPEVRTFEEAFRGMQQLPATHEAVATTNGTHAIQLILEALNIGWMDRILIPGETWQATGGAVLDVNAIPELIDGNGSWTIDPDLVEEHLRKTRGTKRFPKAVIAVHLYDRAADVKRLAEICKAYNVFLIEDCAHAVGAVIDGRPAGTWGVAGSYSLQGSKGFTSGGEGGVMVTGVPLLEQRLRSLVSCGREDQPLIPASAEADALTAHWRRRVDALDLAPFGAQSGNYRMNGVTAALGTAQTERFPQQYALREASIRALEELLPTVPGITYRRQDEVTHPVAYMLAFAYDPQQFAGMDNALFREVLHALLGEGESQLVLPTYDPLGGGEAGYRSPVYNPLSKKRHLVSEEYVRAIDPSRANLPVAHEIFRTGITIQHSFLREADAAQALVEALRWMHANAEAIVAAAGQSS